MASFTFPVVPDQRGLFTTRQLRRAGASDTQLRTLAASGHRPMRGVYCSRPGPFTDDEVLRAASMWAGRDAVLTGVRALRLHGIEVKRTPALIRFLVPMSRGERRRAHGVVTVRTRRMPGAHPRDGIGVAPVERALVDVSRFRELPDGELRGVTLTVLQQRLTTPDRVALELETARRTAAGGVLDGVLAYREGAWSVPEAILVDAVREHPGLPAMLANPTLVTTAGQFVGRPDGWFPEAGVAVQVHSRRFHQGQDADGGDQWSATLQRDLAYQTRGIVVVPVTPQTLVEELGPFLAQLARVVALRAGQAPAGIMTLP